MTSLSGARSENSSISLLRISPFNRPNESHLYMAVKAYYDGSGKSNDPLHKVLVLAGVVAPEGVWPQFKDDWGKVLHDYGVSHLHMTDLMAGYEPFKGWSEKRQKEFILDLLNVLGKFMGKQHLEVYSCGVVLDDFHKAKEDFPLLKKKSAEALCVDICVGGLTPASEDFDVPCPISLCFDQGEKFLHAINRVWTSPAGKRAKGLKKGWPYQIASITQADSRAVSPLQAADLVAWPLRRHYSSVVEGRPNPYEWTYLACPFVMHTRRFFNYEGLKERYDKP